MRGDIRNWKSWFDSHCNWGWLSGAFGGTKISVTDIDLLVERNGYFLIGEVKPHRDEIRQGQVITFRALAALPEITAFYLIGDIIDHEIAPREMLLCGENAWRPVDRQGFLNFCAGWFRRVDNMEAPLQ